MRLDGVHGFNRGLYPLLGGRIFDVGVQPDLESLRVPVAGLFGVPGVVGRHFLRHLCERAEGVQRVRDRGGVAVDDVSLVHRAHAVGVVDILHSGARSREALDAHLLRERHDVVLSGADPLRTDVQDLTVTDWMVEDAAADAIARFEDDRRHVALHELAGGGKACEPCADYDNIGGQAIGGGHRGLLLERHTGRIGQCGFEL